MPDHAPIYSLPPNRAQDSRRTLQLIKGGFSRRLSSKLPVWQRGFTDKRIRDRDDFLTHREYIHHNPVRCALRTQAIFLKRLRMLLGTSPD